MQWRKYLIRIAIRADDLCNRRSNVRVPLCVRKARWELGIHRLRLPAGQQCPERSRVRNLRLPDSASAKKRAAAVAEQCQRLGT